MCSVAKIKINLGATQAVVPPAWLSTGKAALGVPCPLGPQDKRNVANRKESSRVLVKFLGAGAYAVL